MDIILSSTLYYISIVNSKVDFFQEIEYDTYPPPDQDFVYEDPYVTEEELRLISSTNPQQSGRTATARDRKARVASSKADGDVPHLFGINRQTTDERCKRSSCE